MTNSISGVERAGAVALGARLKQPISPWWLAVGWLVATLLFVGGTQLLGGVTSGDASDSINTAWAFAHGLPACAYPPGNQYGLPYIPPLYPLLSGGLAAMLRIGHTVTFPTGTQLGPHCSNAVNAIYHWWLRTGALQPTLELGYITWLILAAGVVALLKSSGRGRCGWEPLSLILLALVPSVFMCLHEYFHPQDLMAVGLILGGLASVRRSAWIIAGILVGLACVTQQFALLALAPLVVIAPRDRLVRFLGATIATMAAVVVPVVLFSSSGSLKAILAGSGTTWNSGTLLDATRLQGPLLFIASRYLPIAAAMVLGWWANDRLGGMVLEPVPLISLITLSLSLRLVFEVNLWGYYFMAASVLLLVLDVVRGRIRWTVIAWLVLQPLAFRPVIGPSSSFGPEHTFWLPLWLWQIILVSGVLVLAAGPLLQTIRDHESATTALPV